MQQIATQIVNIPGGSSVELTTSPIADCQCFRMVYVNGGVTQLFNSGGTTTLLTASYSDSNGTGIQTQLAEIVAGTLAECTALIASLGLTIDPVLLADAEASQCGD